jgi:hypothetical protein
MKTNTLLLLFSGYTNYWHDDQKNAYRYGSLFKVAQLDIEKTIAQSRINVAEDLHLSGLDMEEGFMDYLLQHDFQIASHLSVADIRQRSAHNNLLVMLTPADEAAKQYIHNTH